MSQNEFYTPSYFGNSHSVPTTGNWFDNPPIGASALIVPVEVSPALPIPYPAMPDYGWQPAGAIDVPFNPIFLGRPID